MAALRKHILPGDPLIPVNQFSQEDLQSQWHCKELLQNVFKTSSAEKLYDYANNKEKLGQVEAIHQNIWAGREVPKELESKHLVRASSKERVETTESQNVFLKRKTLPTSMAFSWVVWGISHTRRMPADRERCRDFLQQLWRRMMTRLPIMEFNIRVLGSDKRSTILVGNRNDKIDAGLLFSRKIFAEVLPRWNIARLNNSKALSIGSSLETPSLFDIVIFSLDPLSREAGLCLRPLALNFVAHMALYVDQHPDVLSVAARSEIVLDPSSLCKNKSDSKIVREQQIKLAAQYYLHENEPWHSILHFFAEIETNRFVM